MATQTQKSAAKNEAQDGSIRFEYDGETYEITSASDWDVEVLESFEDGNIVRTVRGLLGPDQWAKFKSKRRTVSDLNNLFQDVQTALGSEGN